MTKKATKTNKTLDNGSLGNISNNPNSISSLHSLQTKLNEMLEGINHLEDEYLILKHRLKSKLFSKIGVNAFNLLNSKYLEEFLKKNSDIMDFYYNETIQPINLFSLDLDTEIMESIAKHAYLLFKKQSEPKIYDFNQPKLDSSYIDSDRLKDSSEFKILSELNNDSPIPFLKTIIDKKYSQSNIHWQEFTYLYSHKKIILIDNDKDESEKYYIDRASNTKISSINRTSNHIWTFNKKIWTFSLNYLENNELPPNNIKNAFPFFNKYNNNN